MSPTPNALAGIGLTLVAVACFAALDTITKYVSASLLMALWSWLTVSESRPSRQTLEA